MAILDEISKDYARCFKRIKIKRRLIGAPGYEADWLDITDYVLDVDTIIQNIDNLELNNFTQGGFGITCRNDTFQFAAETRSSSYFYGYLTRHDTKVKVEAGYIDENDVEYSYDIGAGMIVGDNIVAQANGTIYLPCLAPSSIFDTQTASDLNEGTFENGSIDWYDNKSVSEVVQLLYDLKVGGEYVFHSKLEGVVITPGLDVVVDSYDFSDWSCKDALDYMAAASHSAWWVGPDFVLYFVSKDASAGVEFTFNGPGSRGKDINIYNASNYNEGLDKVFNRFSWYNTDPPISSSETWTPGDGSSSDKYGVRTYSLDNRLITTDAKRQAVSDEYLAAYKEPKEEISLETKFVPQIGLLDRLRVNYFGDPGYIPPSLFGQGSFGRLGTGRYTGRRGGIKIEKDMKATRIGQDVMSFRSFVDVRKI
ncbi:MAG: hypothetical protein WC529_08845 [Candidatus Margulisiibacteriota bacterium]